MNIAGEEGRDDQLDLLSFVRGLSREQADHIISCFPQVTALLEEPMPPYLQEPFLRTG